MGSCRTTRINLPNSATLDDVGEAYMLAWNLGCLGITIFRDGSKGEQVLNVGVKEAKQEGEGKAAQPAAETAAAQQEIRHRRRWRSPRRGRRPRPGCIRTASSCAPR